MDQKVKKKFATITEHMKALEDCQLGGDVIEHKHEALEWPKPGMGVKKPTIRRKEAFGQ